MSSTLGSTEWKPEQKEKRKIELIKMTCRVCAALVLIDPISRSVGRPEDEEDEEDDEDELF